MSGRGRRLLFLWGDGVVAGAAPRVAAAYASGGEPEAFDGAVDAQGFDGVLAAGGCEAAVRPEMGRDGKLIEPDWEDQQRGHDSSEGRHCFWILASSFRIDFSILA